jgi:hypothetical protein
MEVDEPPSTNGDAFEARTVEIEEPEPEVVDTDPEDVELPPEFEPEDDEDAPRKPPWQRFARLIVPIGITLYILVNALAR